VGHVTPWLKGLAGLVVLAALAGVATYFVRRRMRHT
jgi:hypothetical protein